MKTDGGFLLSQLAAISYSQSHPEQLIRLNPLRTAHFGLQRLADLTLHGSRGVLWNGVNSLGTLDSQVVFSSHMTERPVSVVFATDF